MSGKTVDERVETLEKDMDSLRALPAKVDHLGKEVDNLAMRVSGVESQIVLLRFDMNDGFSAIRDELKHGLVGVRTELREDIAALGRETAAQFVQAGIEMRTLFEEHFGRRAVIAEGNPTPDAPPSAG